MSTEVEDGDTEQNQRYRKLDQGLEVFHDHADAEVDILAVPGLGANPVECWTWRPPSKEGNKEPPSNGSSELSGQSASSKEFNWLKDKDGLASIYPKSRIMLYNFASAWRSKLKVRATTRSICTVLLDCLNDKRKDGKTITRPLIIIGHSMGGVVIAKALCMAKAKREYEPIVTYTVGCAFFGAPFKGSDMAKIALMYSSVFGNDAYESLLSFMKFEKNDVLEEVTNDFVEICNKLVPPMELFCAWEQVPTAQDYSDRIMSQVSGLLQHPLFKIGARKIFERGFSATGTGTHFVEMESAVLDGSHSVGIASSHSDLIRFESIASHKFGLVKVALDKMVQMAKINGRKRAVHLGERILPQIFVKQVRRSLEGVDMRSVFRTQTAQRPITSWLASEALYQQWLAPASHTDGKTPHLWLKGGPGLGKTTASLAAIQHIGEAHLKHDASSNAGGQNETFLAYFLCDRAPGRCTAEDILKSLILQLINQKESLAQHARWFVPNPGHHVSDGSNSTSAKATPTVDNLWICLQDMVDDPVVHSMHLVISNMHWLESSTSTSSFLAKMGTKPYDSRSQIACRAKWLVTSREDKHVRRYLTAESFSIIQLDDNEYGSKVKAAKRNHAKDAVKELRSEKQYSPDLAYYISNFVESQVEENKWIDILCILLRAKPKENSSLSIRKWLKEVENHGLRTLIDHAWGAILKHDENAKLEIEELMHAMILAYEPPSLADLSVLTDIDSPARLRDLVRRCSPALQLDEMCGQVTFTNPEFKERLAELLYESKDPANPQRRRHHGLLALRCFKYIKASYSAPEMQDDSSKNPEGIVLPSVLPSSHIPTSSTNDVEVRRTVTDNDNVSAGTVGVAPSSKAQKSFYPVLYLFQHLGEGFPDAVHELCEGDPSFWAGESLIRNRWLGDFKVRKPDFKDLSTGGMSTLHVAVGIGANDLVSILVHRYGELLWSQENADGMTALHIAARNNNLGALQNLIKAEADIEAGEGEVGTPLHFAALRGHRPVMEHLIGEHARVNAFSKTIGPVINAAIKSGTVEAVKLIMDQDVHFDVDYTKCDTPLSLSAGISEPSLFKNILESGRSKWLQNVKLLEQALVAASESGRLESVRILLTFGHVYMNNTLESAMRSAAQSALDKNWAVVGELLDHAIKDTARGDRRDLQLNDTLYLAATSREEHVDILEKIWTLAKHSIAKDICDFSLYQAIALNFVLTVDWLLDVCGADANTGADRPHALLTHFASSVTATDHWTALNAAASSGNASMVRSLVRKGAKINGDRVYALQLAARDGHAEVVGFLLDQGAEMNEQKPDSEDLGFFSCTALQAACDNKRVDVVAVLIQHGADPNLGGGAFTNPITAATQKAQADILEILVRAPGIDVNVTGAKDQSTPLINAARHLPASSVKLLAQHGADLNAMNTDGETALIMAAWKGDKESVVFLCNEGADVTYRSPHRGLAISAAADGLHPGCATILADEMGNKIEMYRKQAVLVPSKEGLTKTRAQLLNQKATIEDLSATLIDTQEQLDSALKDVALQKHEMKRILTANQFQGENFESAGQQVRAMKIERMELQKQLDAALGQNGLLSESVDRLQVMLNSERDVNAALRKRQELAQLQEEIQTTNEVLELEKQRCLDLQNDRHVLRDDAIKMRNEMKAIQAKVAAMDYASQEASRTYEKDKDELKDKVKFWEDKYNAEVLASLRDNNPDGSDYYRPANDRSRSDRAVSGASPVPMRSPGPPATPHSATSPVPMSPGGGFTTIHGTHRADGSLGGYRKSRPLQRQQSDNLYESSVRNEQGGGHPNLSAQSSRSDARSAPSSDEAQK